ncbi:hypothetical protein [Nannocystis pusilla]|uniref:hypothetical protein n=1 Tax=Nannocystis pusilla TaxID=889268 RepID=UPI003B7ED361
MVAGGPDPARAGHRRCCSDDPLQAELDDLAARSSQPIAGWFAAWMQGLRHEAEGAVLPALAAYEEAEAFLEAYAHAHARLDSDLADRHYLLFGTTTRRLLGLLVEAGAVDAGPGRPLRSAAAERAAWTIRHARSRALRLARAPAARRLSSSIPRQSGPAR